MANSMKELRREGVLQRGEGVSIEYHNIHIEEGLNPEGRNEEQDEDDEELYQFIVEKGVSELPQLEVRPRPDGGVFVVDGHRRHKQIGRAVAAGKTAALIDPRDGKIWIPIKPFVGNDLDRTVRLFTSNRKKELTPLQFAEIVRRLHVIFKLSAAEIQSHLKISRGKVDQALILIGANHDVKQAVREETVSATEAVKMVREHGESAGQVIEEAKVKAKAIGKDRVTAKDLPKKRIVTKREMAIAIAVRDAVRDAFDIKALSVHEWRKAVDALDLEAIIGGGK